VIQRIPEYPYILKHVIDSLVKANTVGDVGSNILGNPWVECCLDQLQIEALGLQTSRLERFGKLECGLQSALLEFVIADLASTTKSFEVVAVGLSKATPQVALADGNQGFGKRFSGGLPVATGVVLDSEILNRLVAFTPQLAKLLCRNAAGIVQSN